MGRRKAFGRRRSDCSESPADRARTDLGALTQARAWRDSGAMSRAAFADARPTCATSVWVADASGIFVGEAPDAEIALALAPHVRRVSLEGRVESTVITLPGDGSRARHIEAVLRPFGVAPSRSVAIALSERRVDDAYQLARFSLVLEATRDAVWEWVVADGSGWWNERTNEIFG